MFVLWASVAPCVVCWLQIALFRVAIRHARLIESLTLNHARQPSRGWLGVDIPHATADCAATAQAEQAIHGTQRIAAEVSEEVRIRRRRATHSK